MMAQMGAELDLKSLLKDQDKSVKVKYLSGKIKNKKLLVLL